MKNPTSEQAELNFFTGTISLPLTKKRLSQN